MSSRLTGARQRRRVTSSGEEGRGGHQPQWLLQTASGHNCVTGSGSVPGTFERPGRGRTLDHADNGETAGVARESDRRCTRRSHQRARVHRRASPPRRSASGSCCGLIRVDPKICRNTHAKDAPCAWFAAYSISHKRDEINSGAINRLRYIMRSEHELVCVASHAVISGKDRCGASKSAPGSPDSSGSRCEVTPLPAAVR